VANKPIQNTSWQTGVSAPSSEADAPSPARILDNLSTAVLVLDTKLCLVALNPAGEVLFETSAKKILNVPLTELLPAAQRFVDDLNEALTAKHPFTARGVRLPLSSVRAVTVDCTVTPLLQHDAAVAVLVEIVQVDRLMRLARDESLRGRQLANREVLRGLAHEIKNPLGGLRGAAQLLERELSDPTLTEYTAVIIHEADRLRNLVDRLIGTPQIPRREKVNLHRVLEHVRRLVQAECGGGVRFLIDYDPSLPDLSGDSEQLVQAVLNIVRNAAQAMNQDGLVKLRTRIERGYTIGHKRHRLVAQVNIEDTGPGIPEELQERVFYPMVTGRAEGTGLGLSIAQDIVQRHGGLIEFDSRPGKTVFTLYLPLE
jgi:two-component system nitrogen regulation sensor histidine kinase GlnL